MVGGQKRRIWLEDRGGGYGWRTEEEDGRVEEEGQNMYMVRSILNEYITYYKVYFYWYKMKILLIMQWLKWEQEEKDEYINDITWFSI